MGTTTISGKNAVALVAGTAVANLKNWTYNLDASPINLDPDIASTRVASVPGFLRDSGTFDFNFAQQGDFNTLFAAVIAQANVSLYLYMESGSSKDYLYGNAALTGISHDNSGVTGTPAGTVSWVNGDATGFNRQTTSA